MAASQSSAIASLDREFPFVSAEHAGKGAPKEPASGGSTLLVGTIFVLLAIVAVAVFSLRYGRCYSHSFRGLAVLIIA